MLDLMSDASFGPAGFVCGFHREGAIVRGLTAPASPRMRRKSSNGTPSLAFRLKFGEVGVDYLSGRDGNI